jgi:glycosyltransferase involved in cell wall biosynthesis
MKILHLSTSDIEGGAAKAAYRFHQGLINAGIDSKMLVRAKFGKDSSVITNKTLISRLGSKLDGFPLKNYPKKERTMFSTQWFPDSVVEQVKQIDPDIIHLHWVCNGFLQIESLAKLQKPIVWTLHDMWAFTGGCHYTQECDRYTQSCGYCPQLGSIKPKDLSFQIWQRKSNAWCNLNLTVVACSRWLAECALSSSLFRNVRVEVISNGLNTQIYKPMQKQMVRNALNLPNDKYLVLFGAGSTSEDPRKGFHYLLSALQQLNLNQWSNQLEVVIFGESRTAHNLPIPFKTHYLGCLSDDVSLALAYSSADLFVAPSVQDNLPNTVLEAMACGVPCLAFDIGGMPDMIDHQHNGFLARPFDTANLAKGIEWVLEDLTRHQILSNNAYQKSRLKFCLKQQVNQFLILYESILVVQKSQAVSI